MSGRENMGNSGHRLALTQPFATKGRSSDRGSPIGYPAQVGHLLGKLVINILIPFLIYGCAAPSKNVHLPPAKAAQTGMRQTHRHSVVGTAKSPRHELSD